MWTAYGDEATGMQDSTMLGAVSGINIQKGTTVFSNTSNEYAGSIVEGYVNNYKTILEENYGVDVVEARLITYEELTSLGCSGNCKNAPSWVYATTYWTESVYDFRHLWTVGSGGSFGGDYEFYSNASVGVRPVIIISKSHF